jgi:hypothetical protein
MRSGFRLPAVGGGLWSDPEAVALGEIARSGDAARCQINSVAIVGGSADYEGALRQEFGPVGGVCRRGVRGSDNHRVLAVVSGT